MELVIGVVLFVGLVVCLVAMFLSTVKSLLTLSVRAYRALKKLSH